MSLEIEVTEQPFDRELKILSPPTNATQIGKQEFKKKRKIE